MDTCRRPGHSLKRASVRLSTAVLCAGVAASQAGTPTEPHEAFVCRHGADTRIVSIYDANAAEDRRQLGGCRVDYTRNGRTDTLWTSKTAHAYCVQKAISLVTKLGQSQFSCTPQTVPHADAPGSPGSGSEAARSR